METLLMGLALGFFAGIIPGAFSTVVATTALERGMGPGLKVALMPLITEIPVMLAAVLILSRLPEEALRWIGMVGGAVLLFIAWKVAKGAGTAELTSSEKRRNMGHYTRVFFFGILSPSPWAFWFFLGGPLLLSRWNVSPWEGVLFMTTFMACFIGVMMALAWAVATGRHQLNLTWYRRILQGAGAVLVLAGIVLIWQSWVGNFSALVQAPEQFQDRMSR